MKRIALATGRYAFRVVAMCWYRRRLTRFSLSMHATAEWTVRMVEARVTGDFNGHGPAAELQTGAMLATINTVGAKDAKLHEASAAFLRMHKVNAWSDLPVWIPGQGETAGFHRRSNARAIAAGLTFRPLATTAADTLRWFEQQPAARQAQLRAGLKPEREAELLKLLGVDKKV